MTSSTVGRPDPTEYAPDFGKYIRLVPDGDILAILAGQLAELHGLLDGLSRATALTHHAPYTWSINQVVGHISDCERVFGYRALRISRNDRTPLARFDENEFMRNANFDRWPLADLVDEFDLVRRSHLALFKLLEPEAWRRQGIVFDQPASTRAFAYAMAGHVRHHLDILRKRLSTATA